MKGPVSFLWKELTAIDDWVKLTVANSSIEAYLIVGRLEEAGIAARQEPDRSGYGDYLLGGSNPNAAVHIFVHAPDVETARQALEEEIEQESTEEEPEVLADRGRGRAALWIAIITVIAVVMARLVANLDIFKL